MDQQPASALRDKASLRALFPVTRNLVYLNHAAVGPLSARATEAIQKQAEDQRDYGALHWRDWYSETDRLRASAARMIGAADPLEVAILKNTSEGISFVAAGFRWQRGDNVVTTALEFPSNYTPWKRLEAIGVECRVAGGGGRWTVSDLDAMIDERTRIVSVSSVAFHNGFTADLDAVGELCRARSVLFCVDAIQSVGILPIDVRRSNISFLAADGHKWMCGPEGAAIFYVAAECRDRLEVLESGWTNFDRKGKFIGCPVDLLPDARRYEAGSMNTIGIFGLRAAIDLLHELGIEELGTEAIRLAGRLADGLERLGFTIGSARPLRSPILGATPPLVEGRELLRLHGALERGGIVCAPREGMLRFAPHGYNDDAEIDRVIDVLRPLV